MPKRTLGHSFLEAIITGTNPIGGISANENMADQCKALGATWR
jgi:hypothetical protein